MWRLCQSRTKELRLFPDLLSSSCCSCTLSGGVSPTSSKMALFSQFQPRRMFFSFYAIGFLFVCDHWLFILLLGWMKLNVLVPPLEFMKSTSQNFRPHECLLLSVHARAHFTSSNSWDESWLLTVCRGWLLVVVCMDFKVAVRPNYR